MLIDLLFLILALGWCILGIFSGFFRQTVTLVALIVAYVEGPILGGIIYHYLPFQVSADFPLPLELMCHIAGAIVLFLGIALVGRLFTYVTLVRKGTIRPVDRFLGGTLGIIKAAALVFIGIWMLFKVPTSLEDRIPGLYETMENSVMVRAVKILPWRPEKFELPEEVAKKEILSELPELKEELFEKAIPRKD